MKLQTSQREEKQKIWMCRMLLLDNLQTKHSNKITKDKNCLNEKNVKLKMIKEIKDMYDCS